jgi:hypothetical protein
MRISDFGELHRQSSIEGTLFRWLRTSLGTKAMGTNASANSRPVPIKWLFLSDARRIGGNAATDMA